jgi:hypothetical protein
MATTVDKRIGRQDLKLSLEARSINKAGSSVVVETNRLVVLYARGGQDQQTIGGRIAAHGQRRMPVPR